MRSIDSSCLTRVILDDGCNVEVAQLQSAMSVIQSSLRAIPPSQREYIANALLNLAVGRMVKEEGAPRTANILLRLGDVVADGQHATPAERAIDLTRMNG